MTMSAEDEATYRAVERRLWDHSGVQPRERRVRLPGSNVEIRLQEVGSGPPVLFVHGGPNSGSTWAPLVGQLDGFRCLVVDRPGTGLSDPWPTLIDAASLPTFADTFVADVLDGLGISRAHLVGSSLGGYTCLRSAAAHRHRVNRMVQMACPAFVAGMAIPGHIGPSSDGQVSPPADLDAMRYMLRQIGHGASIDARRIPDIYFRWRIALGTLTSTMANELAMMGRLFESWHADPGQLLLDDRLLASVDTPTLFFWGSADTFGGEDVARRIVSLMPDAELQMLPEGGHLPWLDDPVLAGRIVSKHLLAGASSV